MKLTLTNKEIIDLKVGLDYLKKKETLVWHQVNQDLLVVNPAYEKIGTLTREALIKFRCKIKDGNFQVEDNQYVFEDIEGANGYSQWVDEFYGKETQELTLVGLSMEKLEGKELASDQMQKLTKILI